MIPKRGVNVMGCEIARRLKLTSNSVEPLSFIVPRKSEMFQPDIFPDCYAGVPALSARTTRTLSPNALQRPFEHLNATAACHTQL